LQPARGTANDVATIAGELLPHLFTRSPEDSGVVIFCYLTASFRPPSN